MFPAGNGFCLLKDGWYVPIDIQTFEDFQGVIIPFYVWIQG